MEITTVHYQKLVNLGDYQNERVGAWANVGPVETAEEALEQLTEWVINRIESRKAEIDEAADLRRRIGDARHDLDLLLRDIERAKEKWEKVVKFFAERQIDLPQRWSSPGDIPF